MSTKQTHSGSCHCGAVSYAVDAALDTVISCNCSMCQKKGTLLMFVQVADFTLKSGEDKLTDYQFNKHAIHHLFCSTCGVTSFARGKDPKGNEMVAVNARCLAGVDLDKLTIMNFDGRSK
ncbi:MAG: GFA family protein [Hyphomicrobiaceae bacterium]|nr:GFA family protein [Hyphomicrobiaceae bacterium]